MPELPDITAYVSALEARIVGSTLQSIRIQSAFLLRSVAPPPGDLEGHRVSAIRRIGKRIALGVETDDWLVLHLMIAGRLHWFDAGAKVPPKAPIAVFGFSSGTLTLTEAGSKRRASLHAVRGSQSLAEFDPGGIDVLAADLDAFRTALTHENHTLKRALTDPRILDGIGNAYSDEILHAARLSPLAQTRKLTGADWPRLFEATRATLQLWVDRLVAEARAAFPEKVTAFRPDMAVHGRYGLPCRGLAGEPCAGTVQRIRYADNETNYCPLCQTGGKVLADRGLSRLLGPDWPRTLDELELLKKK
jgi:formamidopyrimidine-DNA glycosylase